MRRASNKSLTVVLSLLVGAVIIEGGFRLLKPVADPYWNQRNIEIGSYIPSRHEPGFEMSIRPEQGLPGVEGVRSFATNRLGFVGDPIDPGAPKDARRVFLLGGSTMECMILGNDHNPATLLASELRTRTPTVTWSVQNTAHSGDASFDHLAMLVHRINQLEPDHVVVLLGINDLLALLRGEDYLHVHPDRVVELGTASVVKLGLTQLHLFRLVFGVVGIAPLRFEAPSGDPQPTNYRSAAQRCRDRATTDLTVEALDVKRYERNLRSLIGAARAQGAQVVVATQPTAWAADNPHVDWFWLGCLADHRYADDAMLRALGRLNDITRSVAAEMSVSLVDLAGGEMTADMFYDDVHFNDAGAAFIARAFATPIVEAADIRQD